MNYFKNYKVMMINLQSIKFYYTFSRVINSESKDLCLCIKISYNLLFKFYSPSYLYSIIDKIFYSFI